MQRISDIYSRSIPEYAIAAGFAPAAFPIFIDFMGFRILGNRAGMDLIISAYQVDAECEWYCAALG